MSKERLEEIGKNLDPLGYGMGGHLISVNDINWLVGYAKEQVERVQELEDFKRSAEQLYKNYHLSAKKSVAEKEELREQNKRYREALEEIAEVIPIEYEHELELSTALIRIADIIINTRISIENVGDWEGEE